MAVKIDRAKAAVAIILQELFAARVTGLNLAHLRVGSGLPDAVHEDDAGVSRLPGGLGDLVPKLPRSDGLDNLQNGAVAFVARVNQVPICIGLDRLHEGVGYLNRDVEILERVVAILAVDEISDVGMAVQKLAHVRAQPECALGEGRADGRVQLHDRDRATGVAVSRPDGVVLRPQIRESESDAAAPFLDHGGVVGHLHDGLHVVLGRHDETCRQATPTRACVDQSRGVG